MERAHDSGSLSLFASWHGATRQLASALGRVARLAGVQRVTRPQVSAMSEAWLRQHEADVDKRGKG
jgi:hypothetical protein